MSHIITSILNYYFLQKCLILVYFVLIICMYTYVYLTENIIKFGYKKAIRLYTTSILIIRVLFEKYIEIKFK